jgi:hypothetical protein
MASVEPTAISATQRKFLQAAESLGALSPAAARPLTDWPRLSGRELDELIDRGLVREAGDSSYYAFAPRRHSQDLSRLAETPSAWHPALHGRAFRTIIFWLIALLVPLVLLLFMRN